MERGRYIPQVVTSAWKIALTFVLAYLFRGGRNFDYQSAFTSLGTLGVEQRAVTAIAVLTLSGEGKSTYNALPSDANPSTWF